MRVLRSAAIAGLAAVGLATAVQAAPKVGQPAPDFTVTTFGGRTVRMADLKGDVIILNFWATWCGPCRRELPFLEGVFTEYNKYGFQVLAVATEDSAPENKLRPIAAQVHIPFVRRMKGPYRQMEGLPTNYIIDRSGNLVYAKAGALDVDSFNEIIIPLLKEPIPETAPSPAQAAAAAP
jgi:thiol-disulfide isomerase/thioredoxin